MVSPRWRKLGRDLWIRRGRIALMIVAVATSLVAFGVSTGADAILSRELTRAYLATRPADATLRLSRVDPGLVSAVRARPDVETAEARSSVRARVRVGEDWTPLLLFVVPDFDDMRLATLTRLDGEWPPPRGTLLVDHLAYDVLETRAGGELLVKTPRGAPASMRISGTVWDSSLAPAGMERTAWGYVTPETLAELGEGHDLDELKVRWRDRSAERERIEARARKLASWLERRGYPVEEIQVPPPGRHPHQGQMEAVMLMLEIFAGVALLLSAVLVGTSVAAMMSRQVREIGIMKAIGAGDRQIAALYLAMMLVLGVGAYALALLPTIAGALELAGTAAASLNIRIADDGLPAWVLAAVGVAALVVPLVAAAIPVRRATRITVQEAIHDAGVAREPLGRRRGGRLGRRFGRLDPAVRLGLRNALRRPARTALTLGLLATGGAMFLTGVDTSRAWSQRLAEVNAGRRYDVAIRFQRPVRVTEAVEAARSVTGVALAQPWDVAPAAWGGAEGVPVVHTYPDRGHGSFQVVGAPPDGAMVDFPLVAGRWLTPDDEDVVVLNHMAAAETPTTRVGDPVTIFVNGRSRTWTVVGVVRDLGSPATAYLPLRTFGRVTGSAGTTRLLAVATRAVEEAQRAESVRRVEQALEGAGLGIDISIPVQLLRTAMGEHMAVLLGVILLLAALMTLVGVLGLSSTMSLAVVERTRELGVMRAVGATRSLVLRTILAEGVAVGAASSLFAVALAVPLSAVVATVVGRLSFRAPLPLVIASDAALVWLAAVALLSALATAIPAWRASRMAVNRALAYE